MDTTREKSRTYEEIRDKYFYLVYKMQEQYGLDEDGLSELTIHYCEYIHENLYSNSQWYPRLYNTIKHKAKKLLECEQSVGEPELVLYEDLRGTSDECTDGGVDAVLDTICNEELHTVLTQLFDTITPREKHLLEMRFFRNKTLEECGACIGRSVERTRQVEIKALKRLRHPSRAKLLRPFIGLEGETRRICQPVREVFQYARGYATAIKTVVDVNGFAACPVDANSPQHVIEVLAGPERGFLSTDGSHVVCLEAAARYSDLSVPTQIASLLNGYRFVVRDGKLSRCVGSPKPAPVYKLEVDGFQHPYLRSLTCQCGKDSGLLAERDRALLDTCLPEYRLNVGRVAWEFANITAASGYEFRHLNLDTMMVAYGRQPKTEVMAIGAIKPGYICAPAYICACLLYEFPVGTSLEEMLPAFRNLIYSKCFYHVPEHVTRELVTPYNYVFIPDKSLYGFFDDRYKLSLLRWTELDAFPIKDAPIFKHMACADNVLARVWKKMSRGDSVERFDEILHDPQILTRNRSYVGALTSNTLEVRDG